MTKKEIESHGFTQFKLPGKERFVKPLTKRAKSAIDAARADAARKEQT